jgi:hypothetical protein
MRRKQEMSNADARPAQLRTRPPPLDGAALYGTGGFSPTWFGYYPYAQYTGLMAEGRAQEFQIGGEVDEYAKGTNPNLPWTALMGSGQAPSTGYGNAAYVYNVNACSGVACYAPTEVGPVTFPDSYSYSTTATKGTSAWDNYFYLGDVSSRTYTWTEFTIGTGTPTLVAPPRGLNVNILTLAPLYVNNSSINEGVFQLYALSSSEYESAYLVKEYNSLASGLGGSWSGPNDNDLYVGGMSVDVYNGAFWGWSDGNIYTNDGYSSIGYVFSGFDDVAVWGP